MLVAATYHGDRSLISPPTFPLYIRVLKLGMVLSVGIVLTSRLLDGSGITGLGSLWGVVHDVYWAALWLFAWATFGFFLLDSWIARGSLFSRWNPARLRPVPSREIAMGAGRAIAETILGLLVLGFLAEGVTFEGRWINADSPVAVVVADVGALWWVAMAALLVVIGISLFGFIDAYWNRMKLAIHGVASLSIAVVLAMIGLTPGGLTTVGADIPIEHANSLVNTIRGFVLFGALASVLTAVGAASRFRRLT